jgi:hypothetical protein
VTAASDNVFPKLKVSEGTAWATPASGFGIVYEKTDGLLYFKNDGGTEYDLTAGAAGGGTVVWYDEGVAAGTTSIVNVTGSGTLTVTSGTAILNIGGVPGWVSALTGTTTTDNYYWDGNDLAGFTEVDVTGNTTWTESQNLVSVVVNTVTDLDTDCVLVAKTFSTGDTWQVPLLGALVHTAGSVVAWAGLIFTDGTATTSNAVAGHLQIVDASGAPTTILVGRHGTLTNMATAPWVSDDFIASPHLFLGYIRLQYQAANTFRLWFSPDGVSFTTMGEADISKTMTPTHVGLFVKNSESDDAVFTFGPLRKIA